MSSYYTRFNISKREVSDLISKANKGDGVAAVQLGVMYKHGDSVEHNIAKAFEYSEIAAKQGIPEGILNLGKLFLDTGNVDKGISILSQMQDHPVSHIRTAAAFNIGAYFSSIENYEESKKYYAAAAKDGLEVANFNLGIAYAQLGNYNEARRLWAISAAKGNTAAMYNYGRSYLHGEGIEKNMVIGLTHILHSARAGFEPAIAHLKKLTNLPDNCDTHNVIQTAEKLLKP